MTCTVGWGPRAEFRLPFSLVWLSAEGFALRVFPATGLEVRLLEPSAATAVLSSTRELFVASGAGSFSVGWVVEEGFVAVSASFSREGEVWGAVFCSVLAEADFFVMGEAFVVVEAFLAGKLFAGLLSWEETAAVVAASLLLSGSVEGVLLCSVEAFVVESGARSLVDVVSDPCFLFLLLLRPGVLS